jgi:hypothetical protein
MPAFPSNSCVIARIAAWILALAAGALSLTPAVGHAAEYYVSPSGNDAAAGTLEAPFATIGKAAAVLEPGDTCWLRAGTYRETVVPMRSGEAGRPITFRSYPGEHAVVSGADPIPGPSWVLDAGRIYKAPMRWTLNSPDLYWRKSGADQVFVGGVMVPEARWPNLPASRHPGAIGREDLAKSAAGEVIEAGDDEAGKLGTGRYSLPGLPGSRDALRGAKVYFVPGAHWTPMVGTVTASADGSATFSCRAFPQLKTWDNAAYVYYPRSNDPLYFWGKRSLLDSPGEWFREADGTLYLWPPDGADPSRTVVEAKRRDWAFDLTDRSHITLQDVGIFAAGINSNTASDHLLIDGVGARYVAHGMWFDHWWANPVAYPGAYRAGAIWLEGAMSEIRDSYIQYSAEAGIILTGNGSRAVNNAVHNVGYSGTGAGISVRGSTGSESFTVTRNTVRGTGYLQCVDFYKVKNTKITFNDLSESARLTTDNGILFGASGIEDIEIAWNYLHDSQGLAPSDGWEHYYGNPGIYLQERLVNVVVHHNVIWNTSDAGIRFPDGGKKDVTDGVLVINNTIDVGSGAPEFVRFVNNLARSKPNVWPRPVDAQANLIYGTGTAFPDPGFLNPKDGDFALKAGSPAIDHALAYPPYTDGFLGAAPDMGAYEFGATPWRPGADGKPRAGGTSAVGTEGGTSAVRYGARGCGACTLKHPSSESSCQLLLLLGLVGLVGCRRRSRLEEERGDGGSNCSSSRKLVIR